MRKAGLEFGEHLDGCFVVSLSLTLAHAAASTAAT
jgi:hypothetical protein